MLTLECRELFEGCPGRIEAETEEEVLRQAAAHARDAHGVESVDDATVEQLKAAMRRS